MKMNLLNVKLCEFVLCNAISEIVLILNGNRQIVMANANIQELPNLDPKNILGLRPGEMLNCIHAHEGCGCGTTEFCKTCGAYQSILESQQGSANVKECRITRHEQQGSLDLRIKSSPVTIENERYTVFVITDISHEKRRRALERIFFHDILNLAGSMRGLSELLKTETSDERELYIDLLYQNAEALINEIKAQKDLTAAENNELVVNPEPIRSTELLENLLNIYSYHSVAKKRQLRLDDHFESVDFINDRTLLTRVLGNMVKNALESSSSGDVVTIGCRRVGDNVEFWVHNPGVMPTNVQLQIFQRSFSTKSADRGLGTYSMKLLTERYLKGTVTFTSTPEEGTIFKASYPLILPSERVD